MNQKCNYKIKLINYKQNNIISNNNNYYYKKRMKKFNYQ